MLAIGRGDLAAALEFNWLGVAIFFAFVAFLLNRLHPLEKFRLRFDITIGALLLIAMIFRTVSFYVSQ